ncbi:MAG: hypothetical protein SZ59_C0002G0064 [candidate division TM6 bacterium GW2011_GWF2_28_16]|nr:MAG: hypothetical protein SZ59_C0002G0064 [candidate division TM6 bacterium GW2011_GWF2_28_16]
MLSKKIFSKILFSIFILLGTQNLSAMQNSENKKINYYDVLNMTMVTINNNQIITLTIEDLAEIVATFCNQYTTPKTSYTKSKKYKKQKSLNILELNCIPEQDAINFINNLIDKLKKEKVTNQKDFEDSNYSDYISDDDDTQNPIAPIKGAKISGFNSKETDRTGSPSFSRPGTPRKNW